MKPWLHLSRRHEAEHRSRLEGVFGPVGLLEVEPIIRGPSKGFLRMVGINILACKAQLLRTLGQMFDT